MVGKSTGGSEEIGSRVYPNNPMRSTPAIRSEVAMGRWMNGSETFMDGRTCCSNPNGIVSSSPGLRGTSYPGCAAQMFHNPNGVAAFSPNGIGAPVFSVE